MAEGVARIKKAFPQVSSGFFDVLLEEIKRIGFTDKRFEDAVTNLIHGCEYPVPTIARLVSWDKKIQLYNYYHMCDKVDKFGSTVWETYKKVVLPGRTKPVWASMADIETYNLKTKTNH
jgi:hypothetical protein